MSWVPRQRVLRTIAAVAVLGWILKTMLTEPTEGIMLVGLIYLTVHFTRRYVSPSGQLNLQ
jgi:hypothetical protein